MQINMSSSNDKAEAKNGTSCGIDASAAVATSSETPVSAESAKQAKRRLTFPMDRSRRFSATLERQISFVAVGAGHLEQQISVVAQNTTARAKNAFIRIVNYKQVNLILAATIIFVSLYITFVSVLQRDFTHPIKYVDENITWPETTGGDEIQSPFETQNLLSEVDQHINSALSVFILWLAALIVGSLFTLCRLPNIIGVLITGIAFKNIPVMNNFLHIDRDWSAVFRKTALTIILMRAGMGLDPVALRKTKATVFRLGIVSTVCEGGAIILAAHFIFGVETKMSILFGTILSATGPAVIVPAILDLSKKGYGSASGLPTAILASCAIDNMTCIAAYTVAAALIFTTVKLTYEIAMTFTTIVISVIGGVVGGRILWVFPHEGSHHRHFIRGILLLSVCLALNFGTLAIGSPSCGVISTVLLNMVATIKWKEPTGKYKEAETLALMWNFFAMQIMFGLIGFEFDIQHLQVQLVLKALSIIAIGQIARILTNFFLSFGCGWCVAEHFFITFSFVSKATLQEVVDEASVKKYDHQVSALARMYTGSNCLPAILDRLSVLSYAALAPQVADKSRDSAMYNEAVLLRTACVLAIFCLAPTGQLIFHFFGPRVLGKKKTQKISIANLKKIFSIDSQIQQNKQKQMFETIEEQSESRSHTDSNKSST